MCVLLFGGRVTSSARRTNVFQKFVSRGSDHAAVAGVAGMEPAAVWWTLSEEKTINGLN